MTDHTPWARAIFAEQRLWLACYCGWNAMGDAEGTWNDHADSLDAAWAEAEAALPEGWYLLEVHRRRVGAGLRKIVWHAVAGPEASDMRGVLPERVTADDPNPAAALRALAAKLREMAG